MCKPSAGTQMVLQATIRRLFECIPADAAITVEVVRGCVRHCSALSHMYQNPPTARLTTARLTTARIINCSDYQLLGVQTTNIKPSLGFYLTI
jgi:hypothetical protein